MYEDTGEPTGAPSDAIAHGDDRVATAPSTTGEDVGDAAGDVFGRSGDDMEWSAGGRAADGEVADRVTVTRAVELDADVDAVWHAVTDPDERRLWLDDPDAAARRVRIDESRPAERLVWTWWHPGDEGDASTVTVDLRPATGGGTQLVVTEAVPATPPVHVSLARASAGGLSGALQLATPVPLAGGAGGATAAPARQVRRAPAWLRCTRDRWDARLLGLELLFVTAVARVG